MGKKTGDSVVKIDSSLLEKVEAFINLDKNKFRYVNRKQFIDIAVADYLEKMRRKK
jgi:metal-responsive CopG/Arc/MetJ family transcriptional regulator